ncbi:hypothetical protein DLAC_01993 [Tieghemostelium lacteum]|uniref:HTTM-like domain-containing protein n=1 Tax=Tieghemostelium lacteum TaxID=361077 RepID=A0A152A585_TIELA|nr:hypothetical protein DLAC_01993 [Tieghemostelium lacteum]|eukprot:KYR01403.1 hypothetical protein DLAC_01993 [Tieghemostelium lacteum]
MGKINYKNKDYVNQGITIHLSWENFKTKMQQMFGMDLRSVALFRIVMALCVIGDIIERLTDLKMHYTEEGIIPRHLIITKYSSNLFFPIQLVNQSYYFQLFLFLIHLVFGVMLLIGYRTRLFACLCWFMTISLQAYVGIIGHGGDVYFRMMLFFLIFLPCGQLYSVDSATFSTEKLKKPDSQSEITHQNQYKKSKSSKIDNPNRYRYLSFATVGILIQMGCLYVASYFHKTGEEWRNGEATFYAITLDYFSTDFAKFLVQFREPMRLLTIAVAKWELYGIFFMFVPFCTDYFRFFAAFGFFALHVGFGMCLRLGLFFWVTACAQAINIPPFIWDNLFGWFERRILRGQRPLKVYYNTTSPLSQYLTLTLKTFFILPNTVEFMPLEILNPVDRISVLDDGAGKNSSSSDDSNEDQDENAKKNNRFRDCKSLLVGDDWLVTIDNNDIRRSNMQALSLLCSKSPFLMWSSRLFFSERVFGGVMKLIHLKTQKSQIESHKLSLYQDRKYPIKPYPRYCGWANNIWMAFVCWFLLAYNFDTFKQYNLGFQQNHHVMAYLFRFDQKWIMFSPSPPKYHWWHVIHGSLVDGTPVELFKDEGLFRMEINTIVNFDKPVPFYKSYGNHRWFKYFEVGYNQNGNEGLRLELAGYICREFNKKHFDDQRLHKFKVYLVWEFQNLDGTVNPPENSVQWDHLCLHL